MKRRKILTFGVLLLIGQTAWTQDAAVVERLNKLHASVQDLLAAQAEQDKRITTLARELEALREQMAKPSGEVASREELRKLAEKLQEIDQKRVADNERIMREFEKLSRVGAGKRGGRGTAKQGSEGSVKPFGGAGEGKFFEYTIQDGDTLSTIAMAYREKGFKVTADQIQEANPGLKPTSLQIGQKIYIPVPKS